MPSGGNLDDKRIGVGMTMYYPVEVAGALLSMGDAHMAQGDSELDGTGIETSITGKFKLEVVKAVDFGDMESALDFPLGETATHWIVHSFVRVRRPSRTFNVRAPMESGATPTPSTRFITS
jgi:acetamidase/formamidase